VTEREEDGPVEQRKETDRAEVEYEDDRKKQET
jgi:hypothetical protein